MRRGQRNIENEPAQKSCFHTIGGPESSMGVLWAPFRVMIDEESERKEALASLCRSKCSEMDLTNHLTGYLALQKLPQPHCDNLKRMGYGAMFCTP